MHVKRVLRRVSGVKDDFLLTSSHLVSIIIEKNFDKFWKKMKNFEVLKLY